MTRIATSEQVLLLLRERLAKLRRKAQGPATRAGRNEAVQTPLTRLQALAAFDQLPEEEARRAIVRALLTQEFGEGAAQDPHFQAICDQVFRIINETAEGQSLLVEAKSELKAKP